MAILCNDGLDVITKFLLGKTGSLGFRMKLFTNAGVTPSVNSVLGDFTECALPGYASILLVGSNWTGGTAGGIAQYNYPQQTFTFTANGGGVSIYGFYVVDTATGKLVLAEKFGTPFAVPNTGGTMQIAPTWIDTNV